MSGGEFAGASEIDIAAGDDFDSGNRAEFFSVRAGHAAGADDCEFDHSLKAKRRLGEGNIVKRNLKPEPFNH